MNVIKQKAYFDQEAQDFLLQDHILALLDADTKERLRNGKIKLEDASEYIRRQITGQAGTNQLITNTSVEKVGVISFDKARLNDGEHLIVKSIRLSFASVAPGGTDDAAQVVYDPKLRDDLPPAIYGANLNITQDNKIVFTHPVADLLLDGVQQGTPKSNAYILDNWKLIAAGRPFGMELQYAEDLAVPAAAVAKWFAEIRLYGSRTVLK